MKMKTFLACGTAAAMLAAGSVQAATINLIDLGGVTGSPAEKDFKIAAAYWGHMFTNNVTINLGVGFGSFGDPRIIGATGSAKQDILVSDWEAGVNATKSNSLIDKNIVLPTLNGGLFAPMITQGTNASGGNDANSQVYTDASYAGAVLYENTSVIKAIGGTVNNPNALDGSVQFSSDFAFDFDPTDGISANHMDFLGVAIHEIGHALGFTSGVDYFDYYSSPNGPGSTGPYGSYDFNNTSIFTALDMFRYSNDPNNVGPGGPQLDETVGTNSYFSINGGQTALYGNTFSTGSYNGDGNQASHWADSATCNGQLQLGIMDPTFCYAQSGVVKGLDLAAFDAMGWNLSVAARGNYSKTTAEIYATRGVPEPASWALMLGGFGLIGGAMRSRRKTAVRFG
jgi:hypothetical protein